MRNYKAYIACWGLLCVAPALARADGATVVLSPDTVVERILSKSYQAKQARLNADKAELSVGQAEGQFDWALSGGFTQTTDRAESFSSFENPEDKFTKWNLGLTKKIATGTTFGLEFSRLRQSSKLSPLLASFNNAPDQTKDELTFSLKQELLKNAFGIVDRYRIHTAKLEVQSAQLEAKEQIEGLLVRSLVRFWQAYAAKVSMEDARLAKEKYRELISTLERKKRLGVASAAELERARAELWSQEQNLLRASLQYEQLESELATDLQLTDSTVHFDFAIPQELPPLPERRQVANLRGILSAEASLERRNWEKRAAELQTIPELNFVASYSLTGVENTSGRAFADLWNGTHPTYALGLEFVWAFASERNRAERAFATTQYIEADTELQKRRLELAETSNRLYRESERSRELALASRKEVEFRDRVIQDQERSFRQGRIDSSQLIIDYNALYRARSQLSSSVSSYRIALARLLAEEDLLLPND